MKRWIVSEERMYDWVHLESYENTEDVVAHYERLERSPGEKAIFDEQGEGQPLTPDDIREIAA